MIFKLFLRNQWKESARSSIWQRNVAANIAIGFLVFIMLLYLLALGLFLDPILRKLFPDDDPIVIFNSVILFYFIADLFIRYMLQPLPTLNVESYLHLPIRRSTVVHFVILLTLKNLLNYLPLLVFIPFAINTISAAYAGIQSVAWLAGIFLLILNNNFLATYLKRQLVVKPAVTGLVGLALIILVVLEYFDLIGLTRFSALLFGSLIDHPWLVAVPAFLVILSYALNYSFLKARLYPEEVVRIKAYRTTDIPHIKYLESMGLTGDLIQLEMKLWWRNKRTRSMIYLLPIFVLYGFFFYPQPEYKQTTGFLIFVGIFMSGGFMMNYLNYAFGYESNYFDGILTRKIDMDRYIQAKFNIGVMLTTICFIITIPYVFFDPFILLVNFVTYLFNIGVLSYALLYTATFNKKKMDLSKGATFNYQGVGMTNWIIVFGALLIPALIYVPFGLLGLKLTGLFFIGALGLTGIFFRKSLLGGIRKNFDKRKYVMAEGFRE